MEKGIEQGETALIVCCWWLLVTVWCTVKLTELSVLLLQSAVLL